MTTYTVTVQGRSYQVELKKRRGTTLSFEVDGQNYSVSIDPQRVQNTATSRTTSSPPRIATPSPARAVELRGDPNEVRAPIPGIVSEIKTSVGQAVESGATLIVVEAMKMENPIRAHRAGVVKEVHVTKGAEIPSGALLITLVDPSEAP